MVSLLLMRDRAHIESLPMVTYALNLHRVMQYPTSIPSSAPKLFEKGSANQR